MKIIAFDLGTNFAWASGYRVGHEVLLGGREQRFYRLDGLLSELCLYAYDAVVYERPFARGLAATRSLWGMAALVEVAAVAAGVVCLDTVPTQIKGWITGDGRADKPRMTAAAQALGYAGDNEHEADAYCLWKFAEANIKTIGG